jgi:hypothetical protein
VSRLAERLAEQLAARGCPPLVALREAPAVTHQRARRLGGPAEATLADGTRLPLWIKHVNHPDPALLVRMNALAEAPGGSGLVPRAWAIDGDRLLMDRVAGDRVVPALARAVAGLGDPMPIAAAIGTWLGRFHALTARDGPALADLQLPAPPGWPGSTRWEAAKAAPGPSPWVTLHNDFTARNLLIDRGVVGVVDWDGLVHPSFPSEGPAWHDAATFLVNLWSWRRARPLLRDARLRAVGEVFVAAWLAHLPPGPHHEGLWYARARLDLGAVERPLSAVYTGRGGPRFVAWHRADLFAPR